MSRDQNNMSEKRTERTVVTTRDKAVRRHPVKESASAANRGDREKSRSRQTGQMDGGSPIPRRRDQDAAEG